MTHEIKRRLEDLEGPDPADLPMAGLCSGFAALDKESDITARWIDRDRQIIQIDGEPHYVPNVLLGLYMEATGE